MWDDDNIVNSLTTNYILSIRNLQIFITLNEVWKYNMHVVDLEMSQIVGRLLLNL